MDIIELLKSAFMGLVEGITEWLPVSSTGHMILVDEFVKMNVSETFWNMFLVVIQLGAILAVCVLFFHELNPFSPSKGKEGRRDTWVLWGKIVLGCIPAAVIGQTTDGNDRIIQNGEEIRYLDLPKPDQIRKILNYTAKMASKGE